jgi:hypothetical protein
MTLPFVTGSDTSEAAATAAEKTLSLTEARVHAWIVERGPAGATDYEIEVGLGMRHETASARRNGLVRKGRVHASGMKRRTGSGCWATVWVAGAGDVLVGAENDRATRPSPAKMREAFDNIAQLAVHARTTGGPLVSDALQDAGKYLRWLARR